MEAHASLLQQARQAPSPVTRPAATRGWLVRALLGRLRRKPKAPALGQRLNTGA